MTIAIDSTLGLLGTNEMCKTSFAPVAICARSAVARVHVVGRSVPGRSAARGRDLGGRIVARIFVRMLKRDAGSYLNLAGGFTPTLASAIPGDFTFADLLIFAV